MLTGVPLFGPFANVGIDAGYDFWLINTNFRLNVKVSGQYAFDIITTSDEIASSGTSWGGDFCVNFVSRLQVPIGTLVFALGPTIGAFQEQVRVRYKSQTTKESTTLQTSDYQKILMGYNLGVFLEPSTGPGFIFGLSWTGLLNDRLQIPYSVSGGPAGTYEHRYVGANLLELLAGIKF